VELRSAIAEAESHRIKEKDAYLRGGQAVDGYFAGWKEKMTKAMHGVSRLVDGYQQAKLAAERTARRIEADRLAKQAEEDRLAAERARKPERIVEKTTQANITTQAARDAVEAAQATPAAMTRERTDGGQLVTMRQVGYVDILDYDQLPLDVLRPYIAQDALLKAVRAYAKLTGYKKGLPGATIELRDDTVIR
jgi:hypothetical protein